ncbi:MAG: DUF3316 domain-containing protein [Paludibacteraceae bacterium]
MKKITLIIISLLYISVNAQEFTAEKYALTTSSTTVGLGIVNMLDPYLSPYNYSGLQLKVQNKTRRFLNPENDKLSYSNHLLFEVGMGSHPSGNNSMQFFNTNYMFGMNYHMRPADNLIFLAGGSWDIDLGGKYLGRNVNNPFSLDLYTDINATAEVQYTFNLWKHDFRVQYGAVSPLIGCMFVPMQNATYYDIFILNNTQNTLHFSSLYNKRAWFHYLNLDIPFKSSTLRISLQHDYLKYSANEIVFRKNNVTLSVGTVVHLYTFKGKKDKIPAEFINSYE